MNKTELIEHIATQADISKAAAGRALEALIGGVKATLKKNAVPCRMDPAWYVPPNANDEKRDTVV